MQDLSAREGSPITRSVKRDWVEQEDGRHVWETISLVTPRHATVSESLAAIPAMGGPSDKAQQQAAAKRARENERERLGTPFGQCSQCDNDLVTLTGVCPGHGEVVGETVVRREDFQILNPNRRDPEPRARSGRLNPTARDSGEHAGWLREWPDDPPTDSPVRVYDDVQLAAVAGASE